MPDQQTRVYPTSQEVFDDCTRLFEAAEAAFAANDLKEFRRLGALHKQGCALHRHLCAMSKEPEDA